MLIGEELSTTNLFINILYRGNRVSIFMILRVEQQQVVILCLVSPRYSIPFLSSSTFVEEEQAVEQKLFIY